jgi:hypothetical protein
MSRRANIASLTAALEETLVCVRASYDDGVTGSSEVRLRPDRGHDATAAARFSELDAASLTLVIVIEPRRQAPTRSFSFVF